jgi:transcriptional regulator with XRE-family HTH domain
MIGAMSTGRGDAPSDYARAVSAEIRKLMGARWMSNAGLAKATSLSQNYLGKRLRDELPFTLNDIDRIAKALGVDPTILALVPVHGKKVSPRKRDSSSGDSAAVTTRN